MGRPKPNSTGNDDSHVIQTQHNIPPQIPDYAGDSGSLFNTYKRRERDLLAGRRANDLCTSWVQENGAIEIHGRQYYLGPDGTARISYCDDDFCYGFDRSELFEAHGLVDQHAEAYAAGALAP
jgi:hypothetical protein